MKKLATLICLAAMTVSALFSTPASAAGGTASINDLYPKVEYYVSSTGWILSPINLYVTANTDYDYPGDGTVKITKMENYVSWQNYKGYQYTGKVGIGAVNWYTSNNASAGSYSLTNNSSYYSDPNDLALGKYWSGTMWQRIGNYEVSNYSWTCTGSCTPLAHNVTLSLWF